MSMTLISDEPNLEALPDGGGRVSCQLCLRPPSHSIASRLQYPKHETYFVKSKAGGAGSTTAIFGGRLACMTGTWCYT